MKTTVEALKDVYEALGGTGDVTEISQTPDMLEKIAEQITANAAAAAETQGD
mgnify:CR=1 FL=1